MARFYFHPCIRCKEMTSQMLVAQDSTGKQVLICDSCNTENHKEAAKVSKRKRTWPYYNESVGMTFESESHENKVVKERNLTAV